MKITLSKSADGRVNFAAHAAEIRVAFAAHGPSRITATSEARDAADLEIIEQAKRLAFDTRQPVNRCIEEIARRNPELLRLSRAALDRGKFANVVVRP